MLQIAIMIVIGIASIEKKCRVTENFKSVETFFHIFFGHIFVGATKLTFLAGSAKVQTSNL